MNGLDEVAGATGADVGDTGTVFDLGGHLGDQTLNGVVGSSGATGHHAGPFQSTLGTTGNTHTNEAEAEAFELGDPAFGIGVEGVASVDQQITFLQQWCQGCDHVVHRLARLHHHQNAPRTLEGGDKLRQGFSADDVFASTATSQKILGLGVGAVVDNAGEPVALGIEDEIFAHDAEADQTEVSLAHGALVKRKFIAILASDGGEFGPLAHRVSNCCRPWPAVSQRSLQRSRWKPAGAGQIQITEPSAMVPFLTTTTMPLRM